MLELFLVALLALAIGLIDATGFGHAMALGLLVSTAVFAVTSLGVAVVYAVRKGVR